MSASSCRGDSLALALILGESTAEDCKMLSGFYYLGVTSYLLPDFKCECTLITLVLIWCTILDFSLIEEKRIFLLFCCFLLVGELQTDQWSQAPESRVSISLLQGPSQFRCKEDTAVSLKLDLSFGFSGIFWLLL